MALVVFRDGTIFDNQMGVPTSSIIVPWDNNLRNLPAFYLLPYEIVKLRPKYLEIPRNIHDVLLSEKYLNMVVDDAFAEFVWDSYAWAAWKFMRVPGKDGKYRWIPGHWNQYSGDFPLWKLSYAIQALIQRKFAEESDWTMRNISLMGRKVRIRWMGYNEYLSMIFDYTNEIIWEQNWQPMIDAVWNNRQPEDYYGKSRNKYDFMRTWNHSRNSQPISVEGMTESGTMIDGKLTYDIEDPNGEFTVNVDFEVDVDKFRQTLSEKDMKILQMRNEGYTMQEIADELGYKSASAVKKRIDKMCKSYEDFFADPFE